MLGPRRLHIESYRPFVHVSSCMADTWRAACVIAVGGLRLSTGWGVAAFQAPLKPCFTNGHRPICVRCSYIATVLRECNGSGYAGLVLPLCKAPF